MIIWKSGVKMLDNTKYQAKHSLQSVCEKYKIESMVGNKKSRICMPSIEKRGNVKD